MPSFNPSPSLQHAADAVVLDFFKFEVRINSLLAMIMDKHDIAKNICRAKLTIAVFKTVQLSSFYKVPC